MLLEFSVANFRSFSERQTLSLVASNYDASLPQNLITEMPTALQKKRSPIRVLKGAVIYGANASGKSNLLRALRFLRELVSDSATGLKPEDPTGAEPFKLDASLSRKPSQFTVSFVHEDELLCYELELTRERVVSEVLTVRHKRRDETLFNRTLDAITGTDQWDQDATIFDPSLHEKTRPNALFLSSAPQSNQQRLTNIRKWFVQHLSFASLGADGGLSDNFSRRCLSDDQLQSGVMQLLKSGDFGVADVHYSDESLTVDEQLRQMPDDVARHFRDAGTLKTRTKRRIELLHQGATESSLPLDFEDEESAGTRRLFALAGPWLDTIKNGYTVLIDELDTSLHPLLVRELLELMFSVENNPKGAQLIFATHNPLLLDPTLIRRDQIWFVEKDAKGSSRLYPLSDYKPRRNEALHRGYLAGRYGGVPYIPNGLLP